MTVAAMVATRQWSAGPAYMMYTPTRPAPLDGPRRHLGLSFTPRFPRMRSFNHHSSFRNRRGSISPSTAPMAQAWQPRF